MSQDGDRRRLSAALGLEGSGSSGRAVTLQGPAGIGKSQLIRWAVEEATRSQRPVVRVVGAQLDVHVPFGGVDQLRNAPHLRRHSMPAVHSTPPASDNAELAAARDVVRLLDELADDDGLLVIDDAQWIDESSRRVFDFALRRLDDRAPATLIAERPGVPMIPGGIRHDVTGLSRSEAQELAAARGISDRAIIDDSWSAAGTNPLDFIDMLTMLTARTQPPIGIGTGHPRDSQLDRLRALPRATRLALALLARRRNGDDIEAAWARLVDPDPGMHLHDALRAAGTEYVIEPDTPLRFRHAVYADAAARCVDVATRRRISRTLAALCANADSAALHLADATDGHDDEVARLLAEAARRAASRGSPIEAARVFESAADVARDPSVRTDHLIAAAESWWYACFPVETARVTADLGVAPVDLRRRVRGRQLHRAAVGWRHHVLETVRGALDDASLADTVDVGLAAGLRIGAFIEACLGGQADLASEVCEALRDGLGTLVEDDPVWMGITSTCRGFVGVLQGHAGATDPQAEQLARDLSMMHAISGIDPSKQETSALNLLQLIGYARLTLDERPDAERVLGRLRVEAHARGAVAITDFTDACLAELERRAGRWASALSRTMSDLTVDPTRTSAGKVLQRAVRARIFAAQGIDVSDLVDSVEAEAGPVGMQSILSAARVAQATAELVHDDPEQAIARLELVDATALTGGVFEPGALWHELDLVEAAWMLGRPDTIRRITNRLAEHGRRTGRPWSLAVAAIGACLLDDAGADVAIEHAIALDAGVESPRLQLVLAEHLRQTGSRWNEIDVVAARDRFARLGAAPYVRRCDRLLSSDQHGGPIGLGVLTVLTEAELRVAVTVAAGRTNAEAAAELFLSVRTVEAHLRTIFRKLQIRNRVELATAVADSNAAPGRRHPAD